jgi:hypothetical protein
MGTSSWGRSCPMGQSNDTSSRTRAGHISTSLAVTTNRSCQLTRTGRRFATGVAS